MRIKKSLIALTFLLLLGGQTARAEWTGGGSSGGVNDSVVTGNGTYATYSVKFSLARRADLLTEGDINRGNYAGYTRGGAGIVVLKNGEGLYSTSANRNDISTNAPEFIVDNGELVTVNNANVTTQEAATILSVDANSLDNTLRNMIGEGDLSGQQSTNVHAHFRFEGLAEYINQNFTDVHNPDGMLYNAEKRSQFYDRFTALLAEKGLTCGISKQEFISKSGVLVITPVIGFNGGGYLSFPTANEIVDKGLSSVFKTVYDVTGNRYSDKQVPYGDSNGTIGLTELAQYYTMHDLNNNPIDNKSGSVADILARKHQSLNWRYGFGVLGLSYEGTTRAATSITVRATQTEDGNYNMDSRVSAISQKGGNMPVDGNLTAGTTENHDIQGGMSENGGSVPVLVTNITNTYQEGYKTCAYGAFLANGSGKITVEQDLDSLRKQLEGSTKAQITSVNSGNFNAGSVVVKHFCNTYG